MISVRIECTLMYNWPKLKKLNNHLTCDFGWKYTLSNILAWQFTILFLCLATKDLITIICYIKRTISEISIKNMSVPVEIKLHIKYKPGGMKLKVKQLIESIER